MSRRLRIPRTTLPIALLLLTLAGCSEPPQKEIDQAQTAVDAARTAGADKYAAEEYTAAADGLQKAHAAVEQRDYRQALRYAIDARQRAQAAARQATDTKAKAQRDATAMADDVTKLAAGLHTRINAAAAARAPAKELRGPRATLAAAERHLQEARAAIGGGNYEKAGEILTAVRKKLDATLRDVENIPQRPRRSSAPRRAPRPSR